ncbi:hypothetical protein [Pseudalkalibacillus hwajinpoensis]|uniref:Uncharacterized protein n=1 Tax=Guptibacillus hwajinpoensis TaxID=208199 RepID=A0A4U1MJ34_9BACL|nr:hypothetical protein [Pseudalkalibacillus hwajinpoensis]TKD71399.1 hypothetical protein FBF83_00895 [Pseudalkalibacillus hwajinpoensis]
MEKNARGYVQDSCQALEEASRCLEQALSTVEKGQNRERIQQSLNELTAVQTHCGETANVLEQQ